MTDAYIYDAVRTPRGKGRKDGALHEVTPVRLAVTALQALRDRNNLDTRLVDDVVLGCVMPVGEQGSDIARTAAVRAGFHSTVLPIIAGAVGKLAAIDVKLKGVIASTNPSRGRASSWFQVPGADTGCSW